MTRFFATWRFPVFMLAALVLYKLLLLGLILLPAGDEGMARFAEAFRVWCFGLDPATGRMELGYVASSFGEPLVLGAIVALVWWRPLREARLRGALPYVAAAGLLVIAGGGVLGLVGRADAQPRDLAFPGERIRTAVPAPEIELTNQEGAPVSLAALRGQVVLLTGVYASCGLTCPMVLAQAIRALGALAPEERAQVTVVAVTLDPATDDVARLAELARSRQVAAPRWNLVTGEPARVEAILDRMGITRERRADGTIDHANLFLLVDRKGRVAYRFTLGDVQERWTVDALRALVAEAP
jgi:protein SCO1/2